MAKQTLLNLLTSASESSVAIDQPQMSQAAMDLIRSRIDAKFNWAVAESVRIWAQIRHENPNSGTAVIEWKGKATALYSGCIQECFGEIAAEIPHAQRLPNPGAFWLYLKESIQVRLTTALQSITTTLLSQGLSQYPSARKMLFADDHSLVGLIARLTQDASNRDKINAPVRTITNASSMPLFAGGMGMQDFSDLLPNLICIVKKDGRRFPGIRASVQKNRIFLNGDGVLIETGDLVEATFSNGDKPTYEVIDPGFHEVLGPIKSNYQMDVRKVGAAAITSATNQHVINNTFNVNTVHGSIQQGTIGSMQTIASDLELKESLTELIAKIRQATDEIEDSPSKHEINCDLQTLEAQLSSSKPKIGIIKETLHSIRSITEGIGATVIVELAKVYMTTHHLL